MRDDVLRDLGAMAHGAVPMHLRGKLEPGDVVQEAILRAHQSGGSFEGRSEAERLAYLRSVFATTLADQVRRFDRSKRRATRERPLEPGLVADHTSPSGRARRNEQLARLAEALAALPENQRRAVQWHHLEGRSLQQTAEAMSTTPQAVAGLLRRGLQALRQRLREPA